MTPRNLLPGPAALAVLITAGALLAVRADPGAGPVAVLGVTLSAAAVVGVGLLLVTAHASAHTVREQAQQNLDAARRAEAVAADLRDEIQRLQSELARLAVRVETTRRRTREEADDDDRPRSRTRS